MQEVTTKQELEERYKLVSFLLGDEWYAEDIGCIQEVNRLQEITELPGLPEYILGVINLRGKIIPIMDLKKRLGMQQTEPDEKSRILVVSHRGSMIGVLVDSVHQVIELSSSMVSEPPATVASNRYIRGIGRVDDRLIFILDLRAIFDDSELSSGEEEFSGYAGDKVKG